MRDVAPNTSPRTLTRPEAMETGASVESVAVEYGSYVLHNQAYKLKSTFLSPDAVCGLHRPVLVGALDTIRDKMLEVGAFLEL